MASAAARKNSLPHARGGVSHAATDSWLGIAVFPTLVGVFPTKMAKRSALAVFPTLVGVFPPPSP